jgi:hypothetical protein
MSDIRLGTNLSVLKILFLEVTPHRTPFASAYVAEIDAAINAATYGLAV